MTTEINPPGLQSYDISPAVLQAAAVARYGSSAQVGAPYWVDHERIRVGIWLADVDASFGADFLYAQGRFA